MVYGYHESCDKERMWHELSKLKFNLGDPLIIMMDFNEVRRPEERKVVRGCLK